MNLEDLTAFRKLDTQNMIADINQLPEQLGNAWELGQSLPLPEIMDLNHLVIAGMGGSAAGGDLAAAYAASRCPVPVIVHRDYDLPVWAAGPRTLVVVCSYSGNTEETLSAFAQAQARGCRILAITTGGAVAERAESSGAVLWRFKPVSMPRSAIGSSFGLLLSLLARLNLISDPAKELHETLHAMRNQQTNLLPEVPVAFNAAKRMAGQLMGRSVIVFAADWLAPVARRWKSQLNETSKSLAQFEFLPEADHNMLAGLNSPESVLMNTMALFLVAPSNHPRNQLRLDYTRQILMTQGMNTDVIKARGESDLAHLWTLLHFGDYTSYYLAMAYGVDPTPVDFLTSLKEEMSKTS